MKTYRVIHKSLQNFQTQLHNNQDRQSRNKHTNRYRGELSYLAPLGSENFPPHISNSFFCGGRGGGDIIPQAESKVKHHASQAQDRNNKYFILYIEFCMNNKI
jgi:hypothetical protein